MQFKHAIFTNTILKIRHFYGLNSMIRKRINYVIANFHDSLFLSQRKYGYLNFSLIVTVFRYKS